MWAKPSNGQLKAIPELYATDGLGLGDKLIYLHFFLGGCDWYVAEFDGEDRFFGFAILNNNQHNAEWGYFSLQELRDLKVGMLEIYTDKHWDIRPAREIAKILACPRGI